MGKSNITTLNLSEAGEELPLLPDGEYEAMYVRHTTREQFGTSKAVFYFEVMDYGKWHGVQLERFYNVERLTSKRGKNGSFVPALRGSFMIDYCVCFGLPKRRDRISLSKFKGKIFTIKVRAVKRNHVQRKYPECMQYSVIDSIIGVKDI